MSRPCKTSPSEYDTFLLALQRNMLVVCEAEGGTIVGDWCSESRNAFVVEVRYFLASYLKDAIHRGINLTERRHRHFYVGLAQRFRLVAEVTSPEFRALASGKCAERRLSYIAGPTQGHARSVSDM